MANQIPNIIEANAVLAAENAPKEIVIRQDGKLARLFTSNDNTVASGEVIGWIESTSSQEELLEISAVTDSAIWLLDRSQTEKISALFARSFHNLGEIQMSNQTFIAAQQQFNDYLVNGYYYKRKLALFQDMANMQKMHRTIEDKRLLMGRTFNLLRRPTRSSNTSTFSRMFELVMRTSCCPALWKMILSNPKCF